MTTTERTRGLPHWARELRAGLESGGRPLPVQRGERRAAVLVPLLAANGGMPELVLVRRSRALRAHAGQYAFPGGGVEPGDAGLAATALREAEEEVGLRAEDAALLGRLPDVRTPTGYLITPFVASVNGGASLRPTSPEIAFVLRVPAADILRPGAFTTVRRRARGLLITGDALVWRDHEVWGATARMLLAVRRLLRGTRGPWLEAGR